MTVPWHVFQKVKKGVTKACLGHDFADATRCQKGVIDGFEGVGKLNMYTICKKVYLCIYRPNFWAF
ncbi:MAG: hypothetical protein CMF62_11920 [Magnetococcales bacterium]|nr:hypothetical protein [Magnetococcales bacterium]